MDSVAPGIDLVDVRFLGHPQYIACYVLEGSEGLALVDPGPTSTLPALRAGLERTGRALADVTDLLLTHIHLDHAGATGTIVREHPGIQVHVHARGARHMAHPERLLASATRLYGDRMDTLWGEFAAVPESNLHVLQGGETVAPGGRELRVAYTPGHASHHVSYLDEHTGSAFVGDTLGIRIDNHPYVMPVTPPPDVDLEAWARSHAILRDWSPARLCPTHFGPAGPADEHLAEHEARLLRWAERVERDVASGEDPEAAARAFKTAILTDIQEHLHGTEADYAVGGGLRDCWFGLARYLRKRAERA